MEPTTHSPTITIDPTTSGDQGLGDFSNFNKLSIQIVWTGLTAASAIDIDFKIQMKNHISASYADVSGLAVTVSSAAGSEIFEFAQYDSAYCNLNWVTNDCTAGSVSIYVIGKN